MLAPRVKLPLDQRALLDNYSKLDHTDRASLRTFAEFLVSRRENSDQHSDMHGGPVEPKLIPRPKQETVIGAIKRLAESYPMIDRQELLGETSSLMSAHIMQGRIASEVIDDLEVLFANYYKGHNAAGD